MRIDLSGDKVVSVGSTVPGLDPAFRADVLCFLGRQFPLTVPQSLSNQVYICVPASGIYQLLGLHVCDKIMHLK